MPSVDFVDLLHTAVQEALRGSLRRHMPPGPLREHYLRNLDPACPAHPGFLQAAGITQLTRLYAMLADGLVDGSETKLAEFLARITVYQTYEIVSDNLGSGLFDPPPAPRSAGQSESWDRGLSRVDRRRLLRDFNTAMSLRLRGGPRTASLPRGGRPVDVWAALVANIEPALVANIESGVDVARTVADTPLGDLVRDGLIDRYRAVSRTLSARPLSRPELITLGTHSVLVVPTLGYFIAVLVDLIEPVPDLAGVVADGSLPGVLRDAALLSRLLNDMGTVLLGLEPAARREALRRLRDQASEHGLPAALADPVFTRLAKDILRGEFNLCLYGARQAPDWARAADALEADLAYFARLYALHRAELAMALPRLTARLGDPRPAIVVDRFIHFHARLYSRPHQEPDGDYGR